MYAACHVSCIEWTRWVSEMASDPSLRMRSVIANIENTMIQSRDESRLINLLPEWFIGWAKRIRGEFHHIDHSSSYGWERMCPSNALRMDVWMASNFNVRHFISFRCSCTDSNRCNVYIQSATQRACICTRLDCDHESAYFNSLTHTHEHTACECYRSPRNNTFAVASIRGSAYSLDTLFSVTIHFSFRTVVRSSDNEETLQFQGSTNTWLHMYVCARGIFVTVYLACLCRFTNINAYVTLTLRLFFSLRVTRTSLNRVHCMICDVYQLTEVTWTFFYIFWTETEFDGEWMSHRRWFSVR